ncbi:MAG: alpha-galactosidase [Clostridia bacterium]|nr:alpha-galactosidase [Clostridia bacterium]
MFHMMDFLKTKVNPADGLRLDCRCSGCLCELSLTNTSDIPCTIGDLTLFETEMPFSPDTKVYGEGYNKLAQYSGTVSDCRMTASYGDYTHYKFPKPEDMHQVFNMAVFSPADENPVLIGFASCFRFSGCIRFNEKTLSIAINGENKTIAAGETIRLEQIYVEQGEKNRILENFAGAIAKNHPKLDFPEIPTGWCSWLVYGASVTAQNIYDNLRAIKQHGLDLKYIQIDDGYQAYMGDWLETTEHFEGGVKKVCLDIKGQGFEPAIWVAPFIAERDSAVFRTHPDWFVKDDEGKPLSSGDVTFGGWRHGPWYMLDPTHPEALDYLRKVFRTMHDEWKVTYFKLDANMWGAMPFGHRHDDTKTSIEAYRIGMEAIVEAAGSDSFVLGCNAPMWPSIGVVHGMRITNDNTRAWNRFTHLARECFPRNWQNNRLWINDPDTVLLQNKMIRVTGPDGQDTWAKGPVTRNEFLFNAAYTMASGGMVLSSDDISALSEENVTLLKKLIPSVGKAAEFEDDSFTFGRAVIDEKTTIFYIFNFEDNAREIRIPMDGNNEVFDLFEEKELGLQENGIFYPAFPPHSAKVLICSK